MGNQRLIKMENFILEKQKATMDELCDTFHLSKNTVRRDLQKLEDRGFITKVYGGAAAVQASVSDPISTRDKKNKEAKQKIGELASTLVNDNDVIYIDSGTTAVCMIPFLTQKNNVTIVTHAMTVLERVIKFPELTVMAVGGQYNPLTNAFFGPETLNSIDALHMTKAFLGCSGLTIEGGLSNETYYEPILKNRVIEHSDKLIIVTDTSKIGHNALRTVCPLTLIDTLVTEKKPGIDIVSFCNDNGIRLLYEE